MLTRWEKYLGLGSRSAPVLELTHCTETVESSKAGISETVRGRQTWTGPGSQDQWDSLATFLTQNAE